MTFDNPEVIELGLAEEVVRDCVCMDNTEGTMPVKARTDSVIYGADAG